MRVTSREYKVIVDGSLLAEVDAALSDIRDDIGDLARSIGLVVTEKFDAKDPNERWQTAGDVGRQLKWILEGGSQPSASTARPAASGLRGRRPWALVVIAAIGVVAAVALGLWAMRRTPAEMLPS